MSRDFLNPETVFAQAIEIESPEDRAVFLDQACVNDPDRRREVEKLVVDYFRAGRFLEKPAVHIVATVDEPITERPGTVIGPYKLLEQIGEGGFGLVFMAEQQQPIRRKVALKILKPGMDTRQVIARFEAERQALALMDHPNITKVLEGGETASGRPYFVMDLVKGVPITEYCDQNTLTTRERLELFVSVCQAVQHAHQKGIIHRDIKPSNVLVTLHDGTPLVKVIDFGIAKALGQQLTDKTLFTGFAQMIGTPLYMSPEQAALSNVDVDTRSDIYSLGVLLYELLTGTTPFDKERLGTVGDDEMRRIIREEEPPKPSTRISTLGKAATTVSMQRKSDPRRLGQLFRGELDWIVMKALEKDRNRRYETASAFVADVQRYLDDEPVQACPPSAMYRFRKFARRNKAGLVVAGLVLFFFVLLGSGLGWVARDRAARRDEGKRRAYDALQEAARLLQQEKWSEALSAVARVEDVLANSDGGEVLLDQAGQLRQDLEMIESLEEARLKITAFRWKTGDAADYAEAFDKYQLDLDSLDSQVAAKRVRARLICRQLTAALDDWAFIGKRVKAKGWERRLAVARAADPDRWRNRLRDALEGKDDGALKEVFQSASPDDWPPATLVLLSKVWPERCEQMAALLRRAQQQHPNDFWINQELATILENLHPPRLDDAAHYYGIAVALRPQSIGAHWNLGWVLAKQGKLDEAIAEYQLTMAMNPKLPRPHHNLGIVLAEHGKLDEAIGEYKKALELEPDYVLAWKDRGAVYAHLRQYDRAAADFAKALSLVARSEDLIPDSEILTWPNRADIDEEVVQWDEVFDRVVKLRPKDPQLWAARAGHFGRRSQWQQAATAMAKVNELAPSVHHGWYLNAPLCLKVGDMEGYRRTCREMLTRIARTTNPYIAERTAKTCSLTPNAVSDRELVMKLADQAVTGTEKHGGYCWFVLAKGMADYRDGRFTSAISWLGKRLSPDRENAELPQRDALAYLFLAMAHHQLGRPDEARQALDTARKIMELIAGKPDNEYYDWLKVHIVRREAEALLKEPAKRPEKPE